ncbi:MAG: hypothetical protein WAO76_10365 [Georgfuchsia sp.]
MAGDWIKMRTDLRDDPAVFRIAALTQLDRFNIVGRLAAFWGWIDKHAVDGRVDGGSILAVDDVVSFPGFSAALQSVGWLVVDGDSVYIPHHEKHNAESGKERTLKNARQARWRAKQAEKALQKVDDCVDGNVDVTLSTKASTREEKRREDISSSLRSEDGAGKPASTRPKREETNLKTYLESCKAAGLKPIPADHSIREYCRDAGISDEMLQVAWVVFRDEYTTQTTKKNKRYKDWPGHFSNAVRGGWAKLWYTDAEGQVSWSSRGMQEKVVLDARYKAKEAAA